MAEFFEVSSEDSEEAGPWLSASSINGIDVSAVDSDTFVQVFSPFFRFISRDPFDPEYESSYADLPEENSQQDDGGRRTCPDVCPNSANYGVLESSEDMGSDFLRLGLGLADFGKYDEESDEERLREVWGSCYGEYEASTSRGAEAQRIVEFRSGAESEEEISSENVQIFADGLRIVGFGSDTESERMRPETPLWDLQSIRLNEDFEWEDVEERENSEIPEEEEEQRRSRLQWEFLLAMNSLEEEHADVSYSSDNEILVEEFQGQESFIKGSPPTAKRFIEDLPSVTLTESALCAVCKEEISTEENPKQLPCFHHYHAECIMPWLKMRSTCPVCRHELPTDDPEYELRREIELQRLEVWE